MQLLAKSATDENDHLGFLAKHISPEDVQFFYQVNCIGSKRIGLPHQIVELAQK